MKITRIEIITLKKELTSSMRISRGGFKTRTHLLVQVHTDEGITGLGEAIGNTASIHGILANDLALRAVGLDPLNIELLREKLMDNHVYLERKGSSLCAFSAIEMACWDIKGKALKVPVYQLLGGLYREKIEAYAADVYWEEDPEAMAKYTARILKAGFRKIKAHIGCRSPEEDLKRVRRLREAVGQDVGLMIDLNGGYNSLEARRALRLWESYDLLWLEEPVDPSQVEILADLRSHSRIPIAAGENEFRVQGFKELFEKRAIDVAMPDIGRVGGLQEARNICTLAHAYGIPVSPHNFASGVLLAATMHLIASTPGTTFLELDTSENSVLRDLLIDPLEVKDGLVSVPHSPGLGVHLPKKIIETYGT